MRKFDETVLENQSWKNITIQGKWTPVIVESPYRIDYEDTVSMIMRCDDLFSKSEYAGGNDHSWNKMLRDYAQLPDSFPSWIKCNEDKDFWIKAREIEDAAFDKVCKEWNRNPVDYSDSQVFSAELFSSPYYKGPHSFVNFATGKVGLQTGDNDLYLRFWYEVTYKNICRQRLTIWNDLAIVRAAFPR